jgi:hypothetical protein
MADHTYIRNNLLKAYPPETQGTWEICGEDANCDMGGPHSNPRLEVVTGTYKNVVDYALTLPRFFTWGGGGHINQIVPPKGMVNVDTLRNPEVLKLEEERKVLQERLKTIEGDIKVLISVPPRNPSPPAKGSSRTTGKSKRYRD